MHNVYVSGIPRLLIKLKTIHTHRIASMKDKILSRDQLIKYLYFECGEQAEIKSTVYKKGNAHYVLNDASDIPKTVGELMKAILNMPDEYVYTVCENSLDRLVLEKRSILDINVPPCLQLYETVYWVIDKTKNYSRASDS